MCVCEHTKWLITYCHWRLVSLCQELQQKRPSSVEVLAVGSVEAFHVFHQYKCDWLAPAIVPQNHELIQYSSEHKVEKWPTYLMCMYKYTFTSTHTYAVKPWLSEPLYSRAIIKVLRWASVSERVSRGLLWSMALLPVTVGGLLVTPET